MLEELAERCRQAGDPRIAITFPVELPANTTAAEVEQWLSASGFTKVQAEREAEKAGAVEPAADAKGKKAKAAALLKVKMLDVVADRFRLGNVERARAYEAIEVALKRQRPYDGLCAA